jgi:hypothetical protein
METAVEKLHVMERRGQLKNDYNPGMKEEWFIGCQNYLSIKY